MKRIYLLTIIFFFSLIVRAVNVEIDGIMYNINAKTGLTEVVANPSHQYKGDIVIPETITYEGKEYTVTAIAQGAFSQTNITSIAFPNSITSIDRAAFYGCSSLDSVALPEKVTVIGDMCFANCFSLRRVVIPEGVTLIDNSAFNSCYSLDSLIIPNSVTRIEDWAFALCKGLTYVEMSKSLTYVGRGAFYVRMLENIFVKNTATHLNERSFSPASYNHTMLYIPNDSWSYAVYHGDFWRFINIRETVTSSVDLSSKQAYTLMKANTFNYIVYDAVNDTTAIRDTYYQVDENSENNCWQIIEEDGKNYLYNIGAKKFAQLNADGLLKLTSAPVAITIENGKNGITLGDDNQNQWIFVLNDKVSAEDQPLGIESAIDGPSNTNQYYSIGGIRIQKPSTGLYIVKTKEGKTIKIIK